MAGGRRTAAAVAAQYFRQFDGITTVYVASSESRGLLRMDEKGVSKAVLVEIADDRVKSLAELGECPGTVLPKIMW